MLRVSSRNGVASSSEPHSDTVARDVSYIVHAECSSRADMASGGEAPGLRPALPPAKG